LNYKLLLKIILKQNIKSTNVSHFLLTFLKSILNICFKVSLENPLPPIVGRVTHYNVYLEWSHVKNSLPEANSRKYRYKIQELAHAKKDWTTVYT